MEIATQAIITEQNVAEGIFMDWNKSLKTDRPMVSHRPAVFRFS